MSSAMLNGAIIGLVVGLVAMIIGLAVALSRRGSVSGTRIGSRRETIETAVAPDRVFERLVAFGSRAPYRVDDSDAGQRVIVLSTKPTFATWGFFYPIVIEAAGSGSRIHVGIKSRAIQIGPLVTKWHNQCLEGIRAELAGPAARVIAG